MSIGQIINSLFEKYKAKLLNYKIILLKNKIQTEKYFNYYMI